MGEDIAPGAAPVAHDQSDRSRVVLSDVEDFDRFYLREYPRMVALAYALSGSRWCAEDIAQEAFLRAHRSWNRIASYEKPGAWLRRVTTNLATSHVRRRLAEAKALGLVALGRRSALPAHPDGEAEVWSVVAELPRRQRQAFALRYLEGLSIGEIATVLELKESTVRTHLERGRSTLGRVLGEEWST